MESSILTLTKKLAGMENDFTQFDADIIVYINSVFMTLTQIGVGPVGGFIVQGKAETWDSFLQGRKDLEGVKAYMAMKVRLAFDPPQSGVLIDALKAQIAELEFRLNIQA
jgi:hypothetical protein